MHVRGKEEEAVTCRITNSGLTVTDGKFNWKLFASEWHQHLKKRSFRILSIRSMGKVR